MKFALNKPVKIVMLGAGGTGGHIAPHLYRLLHALDRPVEIIIADGDIVEEKILCGRTSYTAIWGGTRRRCWQSGMPQHLVWR